MSVKNVGGVNVYDELDESMRILAKNLVAGGRGEEDIRFILKTLNKWLYYYTDVDKPYMKGRIE